MPVHRSLSGDLQQIHSGAPVRKSSPTLRVLGPGQLKEHPGQLHLPWVQSRKFNGSEQCEFMLLLATQAGSFAVGRCLTLCITRLAGCRSSVRLLSSDRERNHNAGERGTLWVLRTYLVCLCWPKAVLWPVRTVNCRRYGRGHGVRSCCLGWWEQV